MICTLLTAAILQGATTVTLDQALTRALTTRPQSLGAAAAAAEGRGAQQVATTIPNPALQFESDQFSPTRKLTIVQPLGWLTRRPSDVATGRALAARGVADSAQMIADLGFDVRRAFCWCHSR
jgi:hypothetical protein